MAQSTRYHEPFFWHRIVNVGWSTGAVVIVQVTAPETKFYDVFSVDPPEGFTDIFGGLTVTEEDYEDHFILRMGDVGSAGEVVTETALDDIFIWDDWIGVVPIGTDISEQIALKNAGTGYGPNLHFIGQGVKTNPTVDPTIGAPETAALGDIKEHTHPNGSTVSYRSGYTLVTNDNGFIYSNMETWYWHRITTRPAQTAAILRRSFLVNHRKDFVRVGELFDFVNALDSPLEWSIRGFPQGTSFTVSGGVMTPVGGVAPIFSGAGSVAGGHAGVIRQFNATGFVGG